MLQTSVRFDLRTYSVLTHKGSFGQEEPVARLRFFVNLLDRADRRLGDQTIEGRKCIGFEIAANKYGSNPDTWKTRVWFDAETKLPARIEQEHPVADQGTKARIIVQDRFDWAPEVPDGTFTPAIPPDVTKAAEAGSPQSGVAAPLTLAEVLKAVQAQKWIHWRITGTAVPREVWLGFEPARFAELQPNGRALFEDARADRGYVYDPDTDTVTVGPRSQKDAEREHAASPLDWITQNIHDAEARGIGRVAHRAGERGGRPVETLEIVAEGSARLVLVCDPRTQLPIEGEVSTPGPDGGFVSAALVSWDYPATGPTSIYDLGVPRSAKVVEKEATSRP